jgi:hypothetical protein
MTMRSNEKTAISNNMDESYKHKAERKKPDQRSHIT